MDYWKHVIEWHRMVANNDLSYLYKTCGSCDSMLPLHPKKTEEGIIFWCLAPNCKYQETLGEKTLEDLRSQLDTLKKIGYH